MSDRTETRAPSRSREPYYPTSDGKPMAETDKHRDLAVYVIEALRAHFESRDVYISGNNFVYFEESNPRARVSPDAYVVFGVSMQPRDSYMAWKEGDRLPDVIFEFTSRKTRKEDTGRKRPLYERLQIPEYFLFDPAGDYLDPHLQGYRLQQGHYVPRKPLSGRLRSERLNLDLVQQGEDLRLYDPERREWLRTPLEEARARANAEAENARLRAELEALRRKLEGPSSE